MDFKKMLHQYLAATDLADNFYDYYMKCLTANLLVIANYEMLKKAMDLTEIQLKEYLLKEYEKLKDKLPFTSSEKDLVDLHNQMMKIARDSILKEYIEK
jgi:hypothetical protein